jgi:hypothetical protein
MASRTDSMEAAEVARRALTAWSSGDDNLVKSLNLDTELEAVGPDLVLIQLLAMLGAISFSWSNQAGISATEIRSGWANYLGVE